MGCHVSSMAHTTWAAVSWDPSPARLPHNPRLYNCTGESVDEQTSPSSTRPICRFPGCIQDWHHFGHRSWRGASDCLQTRTLVCSRTSAIAPVRCLRERACVGGQHTWRPRRLVLSLRGGKESCLPPPRGVRQTPSGVSAHPRCHHSQHQGAPHGPAFGAVDVPRMRI